MNESQLHSARIGWRSSLITRVILLCAVLLACLFGSVYVLTQHYHSWVVAELGSQVDAIANQLEISYTDDPGADLEVSARDLLAKQPNVEFRILDTAPSSFREGSAIEPEMSIKKGMRIITSAFRVGDEVRYLELRFPTTTSAELLRVLKNRYMLLLTAGFLIALAGMVLVIWRTLQPLRALSHSIARTAEGERVTLSIEHGSGEVLALSRRFNEMVVALEEKERMEEKLRQAQRLSALGNLAAGVAHDVRNPLNAIKLLSSHAGDTLGDAPETASARKHLGTIRKEVDRLEDIISSFLSLAKEREIQPERCGVDALLEECATLVARDAEGRGVSFQQDLRAGDTAFMLDPKQWKRAVLNVLINAFEACPEGGRVRLYSRLTDSACEIEIRDDGPGLTRDQQARVFEPYYTTKATGTGLGLSITRGIVEEHGGSIEMTGEEDQGTQVVVRLPLENRVL